MKIVADSIRAGLAHLAASQAPDGGFRTSVIVGGPGFPTGEHASPFVTALVLDSLAVAAHAIDLRDVVARATAYLLSQMDPDGLWRFYECTPPLRRDLDSTSTSLWALRRAGAPLDVDAHARRLLAYRDGDGRFLTWADGRARGLRDRVRRALDLVRGAFNPVDPTVNANVVALLREVGVEVPDAERFVVAGARDADGRGTPYYVHQECLAYALSKAASSGAAAAPELRAAASDLVRRLWARHGTADDVPAFRRARLVAAAARLAAAARATDGRDDTCGGDPAWPDGEGTVAALLADQADDGSWPCAAVWTAVRWAHGAPRPLLGSSAVETALAIEVLARCR